MPETNLTLGGRAAGLSINVPPAPPFCSQPLASTPPPHSFSPLSPSLSYLLSYLQYSFNPHHLSLASLSLFFIVLLFLHFPNNTSVSSLASFSLFFSSLLFIFQPLRGETETETEGEKEKEKERSVLVVGGDEWSVCHIHSL